MNIRIKGPHSTILASALKTLINDETIHDARGAEDGQFELWTDYDEDNEEGERDDELVDLLRTICIAANHELICE